MFEFFSKVAEGVTIAALIAIAAFIWNLTQTLKPLKRFMEMTEARLKKSEMRLDVADMLWSQDFKTSIRTEMIASGQQDFPVKIRKARSSDV